MYVLARHEGEEIDIADGLITIRVLSITGKITRIGIDAPKEIRVVRREAPPKDKDDDGR